MGFLSKLRRTLGFGHGNSWPLQRAGCRLLPVLQPATWDGAGNGFARRLFGSQTLREEDPWVSFVRFADDDHYPDDVVSRDHPERIDGEVVTLAGLERRAIHELDRYMRHTVRAWVVEDGTVHIAEPFVAASFVLHYPLLATLQRDVFRSEQLLVAIPTQGELFAIGSLDTKLLWDRIAEARPTGEEQLSGAVFMFRDGKLHGIGEDVRDKDLVLHLSSG